MKAAFIRQYGGPDVIEYGESPDPVAVPGERWGGDDVACASVNGADWKVRIGQYKYLDVSDWDGTRFFRRDQGPSVTASPISRWATRCSARPAGGPRGRERREGPMVPAAVIARKPDGIFAHRCGSPWHSPWPRHCAQRRSRDTLNAQSRRDDPDPGRRRRGRELRHSGRQADRARVITTTSGANRD